MANTSVAAAAAVPFWLCNQTPGDCHLWLSASSERGAQVMLPGGRQSDEKTSPRTGEQAGREGKHPRVTLGWHEHDICVGD